MLSDVQRGFVETRRVGHLATADAGGAPHLVPVCYALAGEALYITIDEKPKRRDVPLKRVRNILENPQTAFVVDRWDENWSVPAATHFLLTSPGRYDAIVEWRDATRPTVRCFFPTDFIKL